MNATAAPALTRVERLAFAIGLLLAAALMWPLRGYLTDDTFIRLQYARHLAHGDGLVFNLGERVYGCTSPLWVALVAGGMRLGLDGVVAARALGALSTLASVALFFMLLRRTLVTPELRALATVAWAGHAWMLRWSVSGMETPLAVALTLGGFVAFTEGRQWGSRPIRTGTWWALAALARPEAALLLSLWCALSIADARNRQGLRRLVLGMAPALAIYGSWLLFARLYFGSFWPETLSAKNVAGGSPAASVSALWREARIVGATDGALSLALLVGLAARARRRWGAPETAQALLPWLWLAALPALYAARGVSVISRYLLPLLPVLAWLAWRAVERGWPAPPGRRSRVAGIGLALAALVLAQQLAVYRFQVLPQVTTFTAGLERGPMRFGRWLGRNAPERCTVATADIGAIGYLSRRRILDLGGLVSPRMLPLLAREPQEEVVSRFRFATVERPLFLVDRASRPDDLARRSPYGACLTAIDRAAVPNLGIAHPEQEVYTLYRVSWSTYDRLTAAR